MKGASLLGNQSSDIYQTGFTRAIIEEEYAAKLSKLAKAPIGGDEIG